MDTISLIFLLAAVFSFAHVGEAVNCYTCSYNTVEGGDERCVDPFDSNSGVPTVTGCEYGCIKTSSDPGTGAGKTWARHCNPQPLSQCVNSCRSGGGATACVHCCNSYLCNGVGTIYAVSLLAPVCGSFLAILAGHFW